MSQAHYIRYGDRDAQVLLGMLDAGEQHDRDVAVLLCGPFGNLDLCSYRARRTWAQHLAGDGYTTLRIDLPATGDSAGGPWDGDLLDTWVNAVAASSTWLRAQTGAARIAVIGIGLGGLLAYAAAAGGADIDELVLWAVPSRGRTLVRELRALSRLEAAAGEEGEPARAAGLAPGALATAGSILSAETLAAIERLDLTQLQLRGKRVLLLERDGIAVDARLLASAQEHAAVVTVANGDGYGAMVTEPQRSVAPVNVFVTVADWLQAAPTPQPATTDATPLTPINELRVQVGEVTVTETTLTFVQAPGGSTTGVLARKASAQTSPASVCAVLLNAGALRRIGPNRMWVELARRWAAEGVATLRIDLAGIGDADGDERDLIEDEGFYVPAFIEQVGAVLDELPQRGLGSQFLLVGLCSGAHWALHAALADRRVVGVCMLNPKAIFWHSRLDAVRDARNIGKIRRPTTWLKLARGDISRERVRVIGRGVRASMGGVMAQLGQRKLAWSVDSRDELAAALELSAAHGQRLLLAFTDHEALLEEMRLDGSLERFHAASNITVELVPSAVEAHTLEPLALQQAMHALLDEHLQRVLAVCTERSSVAPRA